MAKVPLTLRMFRCAFASTAKKGAFLGDKSKSRGEYNCTGLSGMKPTSSEVILVGYRSAYLGRDLVYTMSQGCAGVLNSVD